MNNPVHSGLLVLELSKISIFEFWYDYIKRKCGEKAKYLENNKTNRLTNIN